MIHPQGSPPRGPAPAPRLPRASGLGKGVGARGGDHGRPPARRPGVSGTGPKRKPRKGDRPHRGRLRLSFQRSKGPGRLNRRRQGQGDTARQPGGVTGPGDPSAPLGPEQGRPSPGVLSARACDTSRCSPLWEGCGADLTLFTKNFLVCKEQSSVGEKVNQQKSLQNMFLINKHGGLRFHHTICSTYNPRTD